MHICAIGHTLRPPEIGQNRENEHRKKHAHTHKHISIDSKASLRKRPSIIWKRKSQLHLSHFQSHCSPHGFCKFTFFELANEPILHSFFQCFFFSSNRIHWNIFISHIFFVVSLWLQKINISIYFLSFIGLKMCTDTKKNSYINSNSKSEIEKNWQLWRFPSNE